MWCGDIASKLAEGEAAGRIKLYQQGANLDNDINDIKLYISQKDRY